MALVVRMVFDYRLEVNLQDLEGNTAAHLTINAPPTNIGTTTSHNIWLDLTSDIYSLSLPLPL